MSCLLKDNVGVLDSIDAQLKELESMDEEIYEELYSSSLLEDIDRLKSLKEAAKQKEASYIRAEKLRTIADQEADNELELGFKTFNGYPDGRFAVHWNGASNPSVGVLRSLRKVNGSYELKFSMSGKNKVYTYNFSSETTGRSKTKNNKFIEVPAIQPTIHEDISKRKVLKSSDKGNPRVLPDKMKVDEYVHGSIESMKRTLDRLHLLGGEKARDEELSYLHSLLDKMSPEFFTNMDLFLKETSDKSLGTVRAKRIDMQVNNSAPTIGNQQSEASIFVEEILHSMTMFAIELAENDKTPKSVKARKLVRNLDHLMEVTRKNLKPEHLLPKVSINKEGERKGAEELYNYIIEGKTNRYEFLAKVLTVPELREAVSNIKIKEAKSKNASVLEKLINFFRDIVNAFLGNYKFSDRNKNVLDGTLNLAYALGEINKEAEQKGFDTGLMSTAFDLLNEADYKVSTVFNGIKDYLPKGKEKIDMPKDTDSLFKKVKWLAESIVFILTNGNYTKAAGYIASQLGLPPESTLREIISGLFPSEPAQRLVEVLGLQSGYIDKIRNDQITLVRDSVYTGFSKGYSVTKAEEEALTAIIADLDLSLLMDNKSADGSGHTYDNKEIRKLLTDSQYLENRLNKIGKALRESDKEHYNWHSTQAYGLGMFIATHKGRKSQNMNAENIAKGYLSSHRKQANKKVVALIDEMATLAGIKYSSKQEKEVVADLMRREYKGVKHVADLYEGFKINSDVVAFDGSKAHKIKGYRRELFDESIAIEIAPAEKRKEMEVAGFTFIKTLTPKTGQVQLKSMALYTTSSLSKDDRLRGATRINSIHSRGFKVSESQYAEGRLDPYASGQREIKRIKRIALKEAELAEKGRLNLRESEYGLVPVINEFGEVVDYRHMMSKENKKKLLNEDTRMAEVLAKSYGSLIDKSKSKEHNALVLDNILKDMKENYEGADKDKDYVLGKDGLTEYVVIKKNAKEESIKEIWALMPREFRLAAEKREDKSLAVPRAYMDLYFGYTQSSLSRFPGLAKVTPNMLRKVIKMAEALWIDLVKIAKSNILVKIPAVILGNILSNFLMEVVRGGNPITITKLYLESFRELKSYNNDNKTLNELKNSLLKMQVRLGKDNITDNVSGKMKEKVEKTKTEIELLERKLKEYPVHELMMMGLDQSVDDSDSDADTNIWSKLSDDYVFSKSPEIVKDGFDLVFFNKGTPMYKVGHEALEMSDLIARDVRFRLDREKQQKQEQGALSLPTWWVEYKGEGYKPKQKLQGLELEEFRKMSLEVIKYDLIEDFINYTKPSGRTEEYLNRVGIFMFTKYVKRIQRIIMKQSGQGPMKFALGALAIGYLGGLPSIYEQSFMAKDWYSDSLGPGNIFPLYAPTDHIMNVLTPTLLKLT